MKFQINSFHIKCLLLKSVIASAAFALFPLTSFLNSLLRASKARCTCPNSVVNNITTILAGFQLRKFTISTFFEFGKSTTREGNVMSSATDNLAEAVLRQLRRSFMYHKKLKVKGEVYSFALDKVLLTQYCGKSSSCVPEHQITRE